MTLWGFDEIAERTGGRWLRAPGAGDPPPVGAAIDTREIKPGMLFAAFKGEATDGHLHLPAAAQAGAGMAIVTDADAVPAGVDMPLLLVADARAALATLASWWRDLVPGLKVIAITGSNGKTTTCRLMHAAACTESAGGGGGLRGTAPSKSFNNELGVPITLLNARPDDRVLVCEVGMSTPGEIAARCRTARPDAAIITTVAEAHFAGLGSLEAIAKEKAAVAAAIGPEGIVVITAGLAVLDDALDACGTRARIVRVGPEESGGARLGDVRTVPGGTAFTLGESAFTVPLVGAHNAHNAALAVVVARWLGLEDGVIARGLATSEPVPMRLEPSVIATDPPITLINDAYNANPGSMRAAIAVLAGAPVVAGGRRVAVLGDMLELGSIARRAHAEILALARGPGIDAVITLGPQFAGAGGGSGPDHAEATTDDAAVGRIASLVRPGDTVLIKGSRGVRLERLVRELRQRHAHAGSNA